MTDEPTTHSTRFAEVQHRAADRLITLDQTSRILEAARRGAGRPDTLSTKEIQSICRSLIVHFAQMGIS